MEATTHALDAQRLSRTHCALGQLALSRLGIKVHYDSPVLITYSGSREAMLTAGLVEDGQLPGCGYVNTKRFTNALGQTMKVSRRGKSNVEVTVWLGSLRDLAECQKELGFERYTQCLNATMAVIARAAGLEVAA